MRVPKINIVFNNKSSNIVVKALTMLVFFYLLPGYILIMSAVAQQKIRRNPLEFKKGMSVLSIVWQVIAFIVSTVIWGIIAIFVSAKLQS